MWKIFVVALLVVGCGSVELAAPDGGLGASVDVGSDIGTLDRDEKDCGPEDRVTRLHEDGAPLAPETQPSIDAGTLFSPPVDTGPSCEDRCAAWCAGGKIGSLIGCGCGC
jgi:hypothetical protein